MILPHCDHAKPSGALCCIDCLFTAANMERSDDAHGERLNLPRGLTCNHPNRQPGRECRDCRIAEASKIVRANMAESRKAHAERIAAEFHAAYERLAPSHGYETRKAFAKPWADVPEANKNLMVATVLDLIDREVIR